MYVNLGATWYESLLQTGVALYDKYRVVADVKKQRQTATQYRQYLEEQARIVAEQRAMAVQLKTTEAGKAQPSYVPYYLLGGGALVAAMLYMRK
jgi:hypothetical protein